MKIFLTAYSRGGEVFAKPRVVAVNSEGLIVIPPSKSTGIYTQVTEVHEDGTKDYYKVYESAAEIKAQQLVDAGQATTLFAKNWVNLAQAAAGATAAAALDVVKYLTEVSSATVTTTDGVQLDAATRGKVRVVVNTSGVALEMWPQTGENFKDSADNAAIAQAAATRKHYVCITATEWVTADDYTQ